MQSIDIYNNSEIVLKQKESKIFNISIVISILFFGLIIYFITAYHYEKIICLKGTIKDNGITLFVNEKELEELKNNKISVDSKIYNVSIRSISDVIYDTNYNAYYNVIINIDSNEKLIDNDIKKIDILLGKMTLYEEIKEKIKEGMA